jgi:acetyl-CoA carboxylase biotin carboxyl carrier protein
MEIRSEIIGAVWKINVQVGDQVASGQTLILLESMKMEIPVDAPMAGKVTELKVAEGENVKVGDVLAVIS